MLVTLNGDNVELEVGEKLLGLCVYLYFILYCSEIQ